jgi:tRNA (cytidine/uridine-2'-O-)-methyltransferase
MRVVLIEPEIPWNTGNIGRTCLAVGAELHVIGNSGFSFEDKYLHRAGLDYWKHVQYCFYENLDVFLHLHGRCPYYFFSAHGSKEYTDISFSHDDSLIFGKESEGLGPDLIRQYFPHVYRIPVKPPIRSLNLSTSVGIILYEAERQISQKIKYS